VPEGRPPIPAELKRRVLVEAGHRCAIPTCRSVPVELAHIEPWATVQEHTFENLIVLCPTCHARFDRGDIDRKSMKQYKVNLGVLTSRYNDVERRILEHFVEDEDTSVVLPETAVLFGYLLKDELIAGLAGTDHPDSIYGVAADGRTFFFTRAYALTEGGRELVRKLRENVELP
jgi:hypothetical protein